MLGSTKGIKKNVIHKCFFIHMSASGKKTMKNWTITVLAEGTKPTPTNPKCPVVKCAAPKAGCKMIKDESKNAAGCPIHACGKEECNKPTPAKKSLCRITPQLKSFTFKAG